MTNSYETQTIDDMNESDLKYELLGKTIIDIDTDNNTITLGDGTILQFEDVDEYSAGFAAYLRRGNLTNNVVTSVTSSGYCDDDCNMECLDIHVLAEDTRICDVVIIGASDNSGYYCTSITLHVFKPEN